MINLGLWLWLWLWSGLGLGRELARVRDKISMTMVRVRVRDEKSTEEKRSEEKTREKKISEAKSQEEKDPTRTGLWPLFLPVPYSALVYPNLYYIYVSVSVRILVHKPQRACVHALNSLLRIKNDPQIFSSSDMHRNCDTSKGVTELLLLLSYKPQRACVHARACMHAFNFLSRIKNDPTKIQKD